MLKTGVKAGVSKSIKSMATNPNVLGAVGSALGGMSAGSEQSRDRQDTLNVARDRTSLDAIAQEERARMERAKLEMDQESHAKKARTNAYRNVLSSTYLQGWNPAQRPAGIETVRGGFNTIPDGARAAAAEMERQAMLDMMNPAKPAPLPPIKPFMPTPLSKPGLMENIGGAAGLGLTAAGALMRRRQPSVLFGDAQKDTSPWA